MPKAGTGWPMKKESAWQTILSGHSNMISPAICFPVRVLVVPSQKISFTDELGFCWKHGETAFPIRERSEQGRGRYIRAEMGLSLGVGLGRQDGGVFIYKRGRD